MPRTEEQQIRRWLRAHATPEWRRNHGKAAVLKPSRQGSGTRRRIAGKTQQTDRAA